MRVKEEWFNPIFPQRCFVCGKPFPDVICEECFSLFVPYGGPRCSICSRPMVGEGTCSICSEGVEYRGGYSLWNYEDDIVKRFISRVKFHSRPQLLRVLHRLADELNALEVFRVADCITYVPMHRRDILRRGYNQAMLIARLLSDVVGMRLCFSVLRKVRVTKHQVGLTLERRKSNLKGAFDVWKLPAGVRRVIIVDDVLTTGSTISECAKVLSERGIETYFFTLASTPSFQMDERREVQ